MTLNGRNVSLAEKMRFAEPTEKKVKWKTHIGLPVYYQRHNVSQWF